MLQIRVDQLNTINSQRSEDFVNRVIKELINEEIQLISSFSADEVRSLVSRYWDESKLLSILEEKQVYEFIRLKFKYDETLWNSADYSEIREWLHSPYVPAKVKIEKLSNMFGESPKL